MIFFAAYRVLTGRNNGAHHSLETNPERFFKTLGQQWLTMKVWRTGAIASRNMKMQFEQKVKAKHMCISWNVELSGTRLQNLQKAENTQLP